jgi:hypothetical protein
LKCDNDNDVVIVISKVERMFQFADIISIYFNMLQINSARLEGRPIGDQLAMVLDRAHVRAVRCLDFIAQPGPEMLTFFRQYAAQDGRLR